MSKTYKCIVCGENKAYAKNSYCDDCAMDYINNLIANSDLAMRFFDTFISDRKPEHNGNWLEDFWEAIEGKTGPIRW